MEKLSSNLKTYCREESSTLSEKFDIVSQIAKSISCLHTLGIVHRDIKLENILIEKKTR